MDAHGLCCEICRNQYSDVMSPKALHCGHTFCSVCVQQLIDKKSKKCPDCKRSFTYESVTEIPTNQMLLKISRAMPQPPPKPKPRATPAPPVQEPRQELDAGKCPSHGSVMFFRCVKCTTWVCRDCLVVDHREKPRGSCEIVAVKQVTKDMKQAIWRKATGATAFAEATIKLFSQVTPSLEREKKRHSNAIAKLQRMVAKEEAAIKAIEAQNTEINTKICQLYSYIDAIQQTAEDTSTATTADGIANAHTRSNAVLEAIEDSVKREKQFVNDFKIVSMRDPQNDPGDEWDEIDDMFVRI